MAKEWEKLSFDEWFRDSCVVDDAGHPLVVFHGTLFDFPVNNFFPFSHFGSARAANMFAAHTEKSRVIPVHLRIKNPLFIKDTNSHSEASFCKLFTVATAENKIDKRVRRALSEEEAIYCFGDYGRKFLEHRDSLSSCFRRTIKSPHPIDYKNACKETDLKNSDILSKNMHYDWYLWMDRLIRVLESKGFDGFVYINDQEDSGSRSYIPLRREQIRSALLPDTRQRPCSYYLAKQNFKRIPG